MARTKNPEQVKIALVQMSCANDPVANLAKAVQRIEAAAKKGAKIVCLQELFRSRYFCQSEDHRNFKLAEAIPGPSTEALGAVARRKKIVIVASLFERRTAGIYHNTAVVIDADGSIAGKYRKMHIPDDPLYYEKFYFTPGDLGFPSFQTRYAKIAVLVCWDQWFPEGARVAALGGAQILVLSDSDRLDTQGAAHRGAESTQRVGVDTALARDRQRGLRRLGQPRRQRRQDQVLGQFVCRRAAGRDRRPCRRQSGKRFSSPIAISARSKRRAKPGRFCATGVSTRTARY